MRQEKQKHRHFTYFLRCSDAAHGGPPGELLGVEDAPRGQHGDEFGPHVAGRDRVDPYPPCRPFGGTATAAGPSSRATAAQSSGLRELTTTRPLAHVGARYAETDALGRAVMMAVL